MQRARGEGGGRHLLHRQAARQRLWEERQHVHAGAVRAAGTSGPITVDGITYPGGSSGPAVVAGTATSTPLNLRDFWRCGLDALESYATAPTAGNFETLCVDQQAQVLQDLWNNKPTSFNDIIPQDFAYELFFMVWCGFLMDPLYGGNKNMVGWSYVAFNGTNQGNFYGEGLTTEAAHGRDDADEAETGEPGAVPEGVPIGRRISEMSTDNPGTGPADVVVLGLGVAGGIVAAELAVDGYKVVGIEKGPYWDYANDFAPTKYDEWGVGVHEEVRPPARALHVHHAEQQRTSSPSR